MSLFATIRRNTPLKHQLFVKQIIVLRIFIIRLLPFIIQKITVELKHGQSHISFSRQFVPLSLENLDKFTLFQLAYIIENDQLICLLLIARFSSALEILARAASIDSQYLCASAKLFRDVEGR